MCIYVCVYILTHTHTHIYIYIYMYVHIYKSLDVLLQIMETKRIIQKWW